MSAVVDPAWVLSLMISREPNATYLAAYPKTAEVIARAAEAHPLPGLGEKETAAMVTSVAWFESRFQMDAIGDCTLGKTHVPVECTHPQAVPHSFCGMQVNETNFAGAGTTREEILNDVTKCVTIGLRLMRSSYLTCAHEKPEGKLRHYAAGGDGCSRSEDASRKSKHRVALGEHFAKKPEP